MGRPAPLREVALGRVPGGVIQTAEAIGEAEEIVVLAGLGEANAAAAAASGVGGVQDAACGRGGRGHALARPAEGASHTAVEGGKRVLKLVTRGVQAVSPDEEAPRPWYAATVGLAKVAGLELPGLAVATMDSPADMAGQEAALAAAVAAEPPKAGARR